MLQRATTSKCLQISSKLSRWCWILRKMASWESSIWSISSWADSYMHCCTMDRPRMLYRMVTSQSSFQFKWSTALYKSLLSVSKNKHLIFLAIKICLLTLKSKRLSSNSAVCRAFSRDFQSFASKLISICTMKRGSIFFFSRKTQVVLLENKQSYRNRRRNRQWVKRQ